ncbi:hypothetical protein LQU92_10900 [Kocuria sp. LUK]|uniref:LysM peptidoglycan-binding domain-containing protein n=1 Tax=Kocuria sp. LUK TaxID=2897828 RepID=UPI001E57EA9C|nr:LysM domain-containing protein [Kocuria sp. LUK]MCD1145737.1 hypothetical protein [Kocuria sp. LUK]
MLAAPVLGTGLAGCAAVLLGAGPAHGPRGAGTLLGLAAAAAGCLLVLAWAVAAALALLAVVAHHRRWERTGRVCRRLSPALLRRAAVAVLGLQLVVVPAARADTGPSPFWPEPTPSAGRTAGETAPPGSGTDSPAGSTAGTAAPEDVSGPPPGGRPDTGPPPEPGPGGSRAGGSPDGAPPSGSGPDAPDPGAGEGPGSAPRDRQAGDAPQQPHESPGSAADGARGPQQPGRERPAPGPAAGDLAARTVDGRVTVRRGDSLWSLAAAALGPGATDAEIARAWPRWHALNRAVLGDDPDRLLPGQQLEVPAGPPCRAP